MEKTKKQPTHTLYILPTTAAPDESWIAAGAGWINKDGSVNVVVNRELTAGTRVQLRVSRVRSEAPQAPA